LVSYQIPHPARSEKQAQKFAHFDLAELDELALWQEQKKVEIALAFQPRESNDAWLIGRLAAIRSENKQRESEWKMAVDDELLREAGILNDFTQNGESTDNSRSPGERESGREESSGPIAVCKMPEPHARRFVVPGLLPEGALSILFGDGGLGKSYIALHFAICAARGLSIAGRPVEKRNAIYLDAELDQDEFVRRAYAVARGLALSQPPRGSLLLASPRLPE
jgi:hypothetical protein